MPFWVTRFHEADGERDERLALGTLHFCSLIVGGFYKNTLLPWELVGIRVKQMKKGKIMAAN